MRVCVCRLELDLAPTPWNRARVLCETDVSPVLEIAVSNLTALPIPFTLPISLISTESWPLSRKDAPWRRCC